MSCLDAIFVVIVYAFMRYILSFVCLFVYFVGCGYLNVQYTTRNKCFSHPGVFEMGLNHFFLMFNDHQRLFDLVQTT